mmetsp:Transcript_41823/g.69856  ORF Transcript_41823/g.69856 Transcript_41823/m.69856 type:complete len:225 (+) Transcript_41823:1582-2256(+)
MGAPRVDVEGLRGGLAGQGRALRGVGGMGALLGPLLAKLRFELEEARHPAGGAQRDGGCFQGVYCMPPPRWDEERLTGANHFLGAKGILVERVLFVVRIVGVHLGVHFLAMVEVRGHLGWPQRPQLAALDVSVEKGDGVEVQRGLSPTATEPKVGLGRVDSEEPTVEGVHITKNPAHLRLVQQIVVRRQVKVVLLFVFHHRVDEISKVEVTPEQMLLCLKVRVA